MRFTPQTPVYLGLAALLAGLTNGEDATAATALHGCKAYPGDWAWPSGKTWAHLNETTEYSLLQPPPPGGVCHKGQSNYDAAECPAVAKAWMTADFHINDAMSVMLDQFANDTCLPDPNDPCSSQGYPAYIVRATKAEHVKAAVDFGTLQPR